MRLTEKINGIYYGKANNHIASKPLMEKLGQLEDVEDELGMDLCHIMKAMLNGYYWIDIKGNVCHFPELDFIRKDTCDESPCRLNHYYWNHTGSYLEDYGKTWALTREELL